MSDFTIKKHLDDSGYWVEIEKDSADSAVNMDSETTLSQSYYCSIGSHDWKWYEGFHMDRFWFCSACDHKNYDLPPPPEGSKYGR